MQLSGFLWFVTVFVLTSSYSALTCVKMSLHESSQFVPEEPEVAVETSKAEEPQKGLTEEIDTLKGYCRGYIGRLEREYKDIEALLTDVCNCESVIRKVEILEQLFNSYESKFNEYYS